MRIVAVRPCIGIFKLRRYRGVRVFADGKRKISFRVFRVFALFDGRAQDIVARGEGVGDGLLCARADFARLIDGERDFYFVIFCICAEVGGSARLFAERPAFKGARREYFVVGFGDSPLKEDRLRVIIARVGAAVRPCVVDGIFEGELNIVTALVVVFRGEGDRRAAHGIVRHVVRGISHAVGDIAVDGARFRVAVIDSGTVCKGGGIYGRAQDFEGYGGSCCADKVVRAFYDIFEEVVARIDGNVPLFPFFIFAVCGSRPCVVSDIVDAFKTACFGIGIGACGRACNLAICPVFDGRRARNAGIRHRDAPGKSLRTGSDGGVAIAARPVVVTCIFLGEGDGEGVVADIFCGECSAVKSRTAAVAADGRRHDAAIVAVDGFGLDAAGIFGFALAVHRGEGNFGAENRPSKRDVICRTVIPAIIPFQFNDKRIYARIFLFDSVARGKVIIARINIKIRDIVGNVYRRAACICKFVLGKSGRLGKGETLDGKGILLPVCFVCRIGIEVAVTAFVGRVRRPHFVLARGPLSVNGRKRLIFGFAECLVAIIIGGQDIFVYKLERCRRRYLLNRV